MINRENYLYQKSYLDYVLNVKNRADATVQREKIYTNYFLIWLDQIPIPRANKKDGSFPKFIAENRQREFGDEEIGYPGLHPNTQKKTIQTTKRFLKYLKLAEPDKMQSLPLLWIESLSPVQAIEMPAYHIYVTHQEMVEIARFQPPRNNLRLQRAQAASCFLFLSGTRNTAFITTPLKAVNLEAMEYYQWPKLGVQTKNRKHATTYLLNIPEVLEPVYRWDRFMRENTSNEGMWFPSLDTNTFGRKNTLAESAPGKQRQKQLNNDLKYLFQTVGLKYKSAHKHRHGHAVYAILSAKTMAQYKAISQNLMHEDIKVTDTRYAWLNSKEIQNQILNLKVNTSDSDGIDTDLEAYLSSLSKAGLQEAITYAARMLASS